MPSYRLYRLDGAGKITTADWIDAEDDEAAKQAAELRVDSSTVELWDRNRLIARIEGKPR